MPIRESDDPDVPAVDVGLRAYPDADEDEIGAALMNFAECGHWESLCGYRVFVAVGYPGPYGDKVALWLVECPGGGRLWLWARRSAAHSESKGQPTVDDGPEAMPKVVCSLRSL